MEEKEFRMEDFTYTNKMMYEKAKIEAESVAYLKANTDMSDTKKLLKLYHKLLEKKSFHTAVGLSFLIELRKEILKSDIISKEYLETIPLDDFLEKKDSEDLQELKNINLENYKQIASKARNRSRRLLIVTLFMVIIVGIMFVMAIRSDKSEFRDYKIELTNHYSSWDEDLKALEEELNAREKSLDDRENALKEHENE